jgi:hypothetical protein
MASYRKLLKEFEDHVRPQGLQPLDHMRATAKDFALQKRNGVDDLICRRYYSFFVVNYCWRNNMDIPENFIENMYDPDGEFINDVKTKRAAIRYEKKIANAVKEATRLHEERELRT